jgi:hypothetical protein
LTELIIALALTRALWQFLIVDGVAKSSISCVMAVREMLDMP